MGVIRSKQRTTKDCEEYREGNHAMVKRLSLKSLKQEYELEPSRSFIIRFAGKTETSKPRGENMDKCLKKLYKEVSDNLSSLPRVCLEISSTDVKIRWLQVAGDQEDIEVPFSRISFVVADKKHQLFAFNDFVSQKPKKAECYAFICNESEKSDVIANALSEAFKSVHQRPRRGSTLSAATGSARNVSS